MFDLSSSKLLVLAIVALLVVGPKDLPALLRTIGRYIGMLQRQAAEFRSQFEEAMRETEIAELKKDVEKIGADARATLQDATGSLESQLNEVKGEVDKLSASTETAFNDATRAMEGGTGEMRGEADTALADATTTPQTTIDAVGAAPQLSASALPFDAGPAEAAAEPLPHTPSGAREPALVEAPRPPVPADPVIRPRAVAEVAVVDGASSRSGA